VKAGRRQSVSERGVALRVLARDELLAAARPSTEHLQIDKRSATIDTIVESRPDGSLRIVVQGFLASRPGRHVALDGFYKRPDGSVDPMPDEEFYEFG
jgi:hypothetical protein